MTTGSGARHTTAPLTPQSGLAGLFGRPVVLEARSPYEQRRLRRSKLWTGHGVPAGQSRPMLVITGFLAAPRSARSVVHVMSTAGWSAEVAAVGRNSGPAYVGVAAAEADLHRMYAETGRPITIIGHSRGGQFARILAVRYPEMVRQVIAVGTPLLVKYPGFAPVKVPAEVLDKSWRAGAFGEVFPDRESDVDRDRYADFPIGIDFVSIYSRSDGIVDWRTSIEPAAFPIEVKASHRGLINGVAGISAIADALARQEAFPPAGP
ncbi:MAG: esterase/lipase family protein [Acidimicrobiales bacterium]